MRQRRAQAGEWRGHDQQFGRSDSSIKIGFNQQAVGQRMARQKSRVLALFTHGRDNFFLAGPQGHLMASGKGDRQRSAPGASRKNAQIHRPHT